MKTEWLFGVRLQRHFGYPVGLIEAASNGSPSGPFLSTDWLWQQEVGCVSHPT